MKLFLLIAASLILIALAIYSLVIFKNLLKQKHKTDYFALFIFGVIWIITCLIMKKYIVSLVGILAAGVALEKRKLWKANKMNWKKMSKQERKSQTKLLAILAIVLAISFCILKII